MQRNNNHIIVIGIVLILLMLTYNMAFNGSSGGESGSLFDCLDSYSSAIQTAAALLALVISVYTFWRQKEMTRLQIKLSLYKERYSLYTEMQQYVYASNEFFNLPSYEDYVSGKAQIKEFAINVFESEHYKLLRSTSAQLLLVSKDIEFLLNTIKDKKKDVLEPINDFADCCRANINRKSYSEQKIQIHTAILHFQKEYSKKIDVAFKEYLDFTKIKY